MQMMKFLIQAQQGCLEKTAGFREWLWIGSKLWRLQSAPASSLLSLWGSVLKLSPIAWSKTIQRLDRKLPKDPWWWIIETLHCALASTAHPTSLSRHRGFWPLNCRFISFARYSWTMLRNSLNMRRLPLKRAVLKIHSKKALLQGLETLKNASVLCHGTNSEAKKAVPWSAVPPLLLKCLSTHLPACQISWWHLVAPNPLHQDLLPNAPFPIPSACSLTCQPSESTRQGTAEIDHS